MTKAKWEHKWHSGNMAVCGQTTYCVLSEWTHVTCPKCLAKKPKSKKPETNLFFELDGKVFITEKTKKGKVVSQEEIDGEMVLKLLVSVMEQGMRTELRWKEQAKEYLSKEDFLDTSYERVENYLKELDEEYDRDRKARKYVRE